MKTRKLVLAVAVLITSAADVVAGELRQHYVVARRDKDPAFEVTLIHKDNVTSVSRTYLIADKKGPLLRLDLVNDYANRRTVSSYALMRDARSSGRITQNLPYSSTTIDGRREELRKHPELAEAPVPITVEASSGKVARGHDSDWRHPDKESGQREKAKAVLGKDLVAALSSIRELAGLPPFADINPSFGYVFDEALLVRKSRKLMVASVRADCAFDAKFGIPCQR